MSRVLGSGLSLILFLNVSLVFAQETYQKLIPNAFFSRGQNAQSSPNGGLVFTCWADNQLGTTGKDIMMVALDEQGDTVWTRVFGREYNDLSFTLLRTDDDGYLIAGTSVSSTSTLDPLRTLLIKTNAVGDTLWTRSYLALYEGLSAIQCLDGGFLLVGNPIAGFYMFRLNAQGDLIWSSGFDRFEPPSFSHQFSAYSAAECNDGGFLVLGCRNNGSAFLSKVDFNGGLEWTKSATSSNGLSLKRIIRAADGEFIALGATNERILLIKLDSYGNVSWTKGYSVGAAGWASDITANSRGGFAIVGLINQTNESNNDIYFLCLDSIGDVVYSGSFDFIGSDAGRSIVEASDGGYYIMGSTNGFESSTSVFIFKSDSTGRSDCYYQDVETIASEVDINWADIQLETLDVTAVEQTAGCAVGSGAPLMPLCPVSTEELPEQGISVQVFPNPAADQLTIALPWSFLRSQIEIFDALGVRIMATRPIGAETPIDCSSFSRGIYLVKVTAPSSTTAIRVVLE